MYTGKYYFETDNFKLIYNDVFKAIKKINDKSIDMIFADPPYFLSNNGITCSGGKMVSVNKGEWDKSLSIKEKHKFNRKWIKECYRVLKDNGTIWISGTLHNIYSIGMALEELHQVAYLCADFKKKNGYKRSIELSEQYHLYRQDFCGCIYSKLEEEQRKKNRDDN